MKIIWLIGIIVLVGLVVGDLNPNPYRIRSFTIGDGTNSSLAGTTLGNGTFWGKVIPTNFLAGPNINISQNGTNITITGAATWTLSGLTTDVLYTKLIKRNTTGEVIGSIHPYIELLQTYFEFGSCLVAFQTTCSNITVKYNEINITSETINLDGAVSVHGDFFVNDKNIETELIKTSVKAYQTTYWNESNIYTDEILVPQDINLTNLTTTIAPTTNSTDYILNYSLERYIDYNAGTTEVIFSTSLSSKLTYIDNLNFSFNNKDVLLLNYTTHINVSKSNTMLKFKVR